MTLFMDDDVVGGRIALEDADVEAEAEGVPRAADLVGREGVLGVTGVTGDGGVCDVNAGR